MHPLLLCYYLHCTESALVAASEELKRSVDKGGRAVLILLDLFAAFDVVHHARFIKRLHSLGFRNAALTLLSSFLNDGQQRVEVGDASSRPFSLPCGVPQGVCS